MHDIFYTFVNAPLLIHAFPKEKEGSITILTSNEYINNVIVSWHIIHFIFLSYLQCAAEATVQKYCGIQKYRN